MIFDNSAGLSGGGRCYSEDEVQAGWIRDSELTSA